MNINKIVKDSVNGIKDKYNSTQLNPFKMPENINITIKHDVVGSGPYMQTSTVALGETAAMETIFEHRQPHETFPSINQSHT